METVNPATGERIASYESDTESDVDAALERAATAFDDWCDKPLRERERLLRAAAEVLRDRRDEYAELITGERGKPIEQSRSEVEKCAWACDHYAEHAGAYLEDEHYPSPPGSTVETRYEPLGPVLAVMPWNVPFWQVFRFAAPYVTAGNVGLLKHVSNVPGCARAIEEVFETAGYPEGAFQSLLISSDLVDDVVADDRVKAATLTGSGPAGASVAETAGKHLKKTVLELGGSDPFVVLDDADVDEAAATLTAASDDEEAIEVANDTDFGLGASVWSEDRDRGERVADRIEAGCVYVNQLVKSDPRVPFGGIGESGYGRELSEPGIKEFVNRTTVGVE